jgi:hypothetical protein
MERRSACAAPHLDVVDPVRAVLGAFNQIRALRIRIADQSSGSKQTLRTRFIKIFAIALPSTSPACIPSTFWSV